MNSAPIHACSSTLNHTNPIDWFRRFIFLTRLSCPLSSIFTNNHQQERVRRHTDDFLDRNERQLILHNLPLSPDDHRELEELRASALSEQQLQEQKQQQAETRAASEASPISAKVVLGPDGQPRLEEAWQQQQRP